jgi:hypothetical protein
MADVLPRHLPVDGTPAADLRRVDPRIMRDTCRG